MPADANIRSIDLGLMSAIPASSPLRKALRSLRSASLFTAITVCSSLSAGEKSDVGLEKISLPSGPGSIEGLGDAFEPQLNSGTSSYSVGISIPPGVAGLQPSVTLRYNSGGGNGPFGIAWTCSPELSIQRQVEKGLPTYSDNDTFTLNGEELVALTDGSYRTENESAFQRIIRDGSGWIIYDKNGPRHYLGSTPSSTNPSRIVRPGGGDTFTDTFRWCEDSTVDVHGNQIGFYYTTFADSPGNHYCSEIRYSVFGTNYHAVKFLWQERPDAFASYLSGHQIRTGRRCYEIRVESQGDLVRRYGLDYTLPSDDPIEPIGLNDAGQIFSLLRKVTQFDKRGTNAHFLPPLRMGYTRFDPALIASGSFINPVGVSVGNPNMSLTDFNADSLPDFLYTDPTNGNHQVCYNQGYGRFSPTRTFASSPTGVTLDQGGVQLADYDGDGRIDLVQKAGSNSNQFVYFPNATQLVDNDETSPSWGSEVSFNTPHPPFDLNDASVRTLDLNNDKRMDFMRTTSGGFIYYINRISSWEEKGIYLFGEDEMGDISFADSVDFSDGVHTKLADLNGDRLLDLCRLNLFENTLEVTYWPNRGNGAWGTRTEMTGTVDIGTIPIEDVFIRDLNGDGLADVMTVGYDTVSYWLNRGNNSYSPRFEVASTPEYIKGTTVLQQADINGNGTTDLLWENFDPSAGAYRIQWVDFVGTTKPNLLAVIDNGIGLRTEMEYRPSTEFYIEAMLGSNPWRTRVPFPSWCVSKITKRFGLDLDSVPGEDRYVSEFSYHDGYYDAFEKEFRGFAFARKVERGDDRLSDGGPASEVNSPSLITRFAFHTGLPDSVDNDGDNLTDEFDAVAGYEEEALKGKVLWTEQTILTAEFDELDNDSDGFIDEADEGPGSGTPAGDSVVFTRSTNTWSLKTIHDTGGGFSQTGASLLFGTADGKNVTFPFVARTQQRVIDAVGSLHSSTSFPSGAVTIESETDVDFFGNPTQQRSFGVTSGGPLSYDDEKFTNTSYGFNIASWIVGLPTEVAVTDENGNFVSTSRTYYDNQGLGSIGARGLPTSQEQLIGSSGVAIEQFSPHPGDPRVSSGASVTTTTLYDSFGNPTTIRDPLYGSKPGHQREFVYDSTFHTYVEEERINTGGPGGTLTASASYDYGGGVIETSTDFNGNDSQYLYDSFFRIVGIVKPGDSVASPTQSFSYAPGDPVRSLDYVYDQTGNLNLSVTSSTPVVSRVTVRSRETAGGGTFDIVQITDGAGHKLGTIEEGSTGGQFVYKEVKRYTSRGQERDSYLPFFGGSPDFRSPPPDGDRVTCFMDALGRKISCINPPETLGGAKTSTRTEYLPLVTVLYDEEDNTSGSPHADTPHVQYQDGLERLVGVDEINLQGVDTGTFQTRYEYDLLDNLVRITDSLSNRKWMRHDGLGRMIFMEDPDRGKMFYSYDNASNLITTVDAKAQQIDYTYDGANRILTEDYQDVSSITPDVAYFYDVPQTVSSGKGSDVTSEQMLGKLSYVTDLSGEEYLSYDSRGRTAWKIKRIPNPSNGVLASYQNNYEYDSLDRLTVLGYPDGDSVDYDYNARNLPSSIGGALSGPIISSIDYIASGQMDAIAYGNGVATDYDYDPRLRLRKLKTENSTLSTFLDYTYTLDGASNITRIDDGRSGVPNERENTQVFNYDDLYRLTQVNYPTTSGSIAYSYDRIGNMLSKTSGIAHEENGLSVTNLGVMIYGGTAGRSNRQGRDQSQPGPHALTGVSEGVRNYPYDANGNMTDIDGLICTWDFKDRLIAVENDEMQADYTYDYTDRRITKAVTPKQDGQLQLAKTTHVHYPDRTFEIREHQEPVKYVWNGETRVARVTRNLNTDERVQRFALDTGDNILALAVAIDNAESWFGSTEIQSVYRYDSTTSTYHTIGTNESLPAGTLLRVRASETIDLAVQGIYIPPTTPIEYPPGKQWVTNPILGPLQIDTLLPPNTPAWIYDAPTQAWKTLLPTPIVAASDFPSELQSGNAFFTTNSATFQITPADPTLEVRYYHQDHLGSSNTLSDEVGALVSESVFYPFGHQRGSFDPRTSVKAYGFTQKELDMESSLHYFEARFLLGPSARFVTVDPMALKVTDNVIKNPQLNHTYCYAENSPVVLVDPTGLSGESPSENAQLYTPENPKILALRKIDLQLHQVNQDIASKEKNMFYGALADTLASPLKAASKMFEVIWDGGKMLTHENLADAAMDVLGLGLVNSGHDYFDLLDKQDIIVEQKTSLQKDLNRGERLYYHTGLPYDQNISKETGTPSIDLQSQGEPGN